MNMLISEKNGIRIITLETDHLDALNSEEIKKQMISHSEGSKKIVQKELVYCTVPEMMADLK